MISITTDLLIILAGKNSNPMLFSYYFYYSSNSAGERSSFSLFLLLKITNKTEFLNSSSFNNLTNSILASYTQSSSFISTINIIAPNFIFL